MRLTEAQRSELKRISEWDGAPYGHGSRMYAPVRRLLKRRLIETQPHQNPKYRSNYILVYLTDLGRAALAQSMEKK